MFFRRFLPTLKNTVSVRGFQGAAKINGRNKMVLLSAVVGCTGLGIGLGYSINKCDIGTYKPKAAATTTAATVAKTVQPQSQQQQPAKEEEEEQVINAGEYVAGLPTYTKKDVANHKSEETGIWVTFKGGVYDITEFVKIHPGGSAKISLAAGSSIDPFWAIYGAHKTQDVFAILEEMRIGNLSKEDLEDESNKVASDDPYANDPERHPALKMVFPKPCNAETPEEMIPDSWVTPNALFFVRNHLPVPIIKVEDYRLEICGEGIPKPVILTLDDLKTKFPRYTMHSTIQCSGNRRSEVNEYEPVKGLSWSIGAISNAKWTGVKLIDVLKYAGFNSDANPQVEHVQFQGYDNHLGEVYGASIPIEKAVSPTGDVLLAFEMNDEAIPADHGFPVRAIVPGTTGARNVKWLAKIETSRIESRSFWQQKDYKVFGPYIDWSNVEWSSEPAIQEVPVQSAICYPSRNTIIHRTQQDNIDMKGFAYSGGGRPIVRVDVSIDNGKTWHPTTLKSEAINRRDRGWAWTFWTASIPIPKDANIKELTLVCKAVDSSYNNQPESVAAVWNLRGLYNNSYHRIKVFLDN